MIFLPPMKIARGEPFAWQATVVGQDWTGWTGTVTFRRKGLIRRLVRDYTQWWPESDPILSQTVTGSALGVLQFALTKEQTLLFPALPRQGFFATARFEISMTDGTDAKKYQGSVSVAETLA